MNVQERICKTDRIADEYGDLLGSDCNSLRHDAQVHDAGEIGKKIKEFEDDGRHLQVGIIGKVKAGKSSLLNALFFDGVEVLPKAATPMTAALTTLTFGEQPGVRAEFYSKADLETFERLYDDHEKAILAKQQNWESKQFLKERGASTPQERSLEFRRKAGDILAKGIKSISDNLNAPSCSREMAMRMIAGEDPVRLAGWETWKQVLAAKDSGSLSNDEGISCANIDELRRTVKDYVGANGKRTPFTKCLHLTLPLKPLKDLLVVDTPGLNDPVQSREHRTQAMLADCDAVFIVSPAGSFLTRQDRELMERLSAREGVSTLYAVASQFDTQLFGGECLALGGNLPKAVNMQRTALTNHAKHVLTSLSSEIPILASLVNECRKRVRISSSAAHTLMWIDPRGWDETAEHAHNVLIKNYPDYFTDNTTKQHWLDKIAGIKELKDDLGDVHKNKLEIFQKRKDEFVRGQEEACKKWIESLLKRAEERRREFESSDIASAESRLHVLVEISEKGSEAANEEFSDQIDNCRLRVKKELHDIVKGAFRGASDEAEGATGSKSERQEKSGVGSWLARKLWGGGYEDVTVETVITSSVRRAIHDFQMTLTDNLKDHIDMANSQWRNSIPKIILGRLRQSISDDDINDENSILRVTRAELSKISDLPGPNLPPLPEELSATGTLTGWRKTEFMNAAESYLFLLNSVGTEFIGSTDSKLRAIGNEKIGFGIFRALRQEAESLQSQLQSKRLTAERYGRLLSALEGVAK